MAINKIQSIRIFFKILIIFNIHFLFSQNDISILKNNKPKASEDYIGFYQNYISGIRGQSCPMYPSCSRYGIESFRNNNFFNAFLSTSDRLIRCGHDYENYSFTLSNDGIKILDIPDYIKIDVDGIEHLILSGAKNLLKDRKLKEILIELTPEFYSQINLIEDILLNSGFKKTISTNKNLLINPNYKLKPGETVNSIFKRT